MSKLIKKAEKKKNLINEFSLEQNYSIQLLDQNISFNIQHSQALLFSEILKQRIFEIFEFNMKDMYLRHWGWNIEELQEEFFSSKSSYLLVYDNNNNNNNTNNNNENNLQAYVHFQVSKIK